jgi:hypothetical protein
MQAVVTGMIATYPFGGVAWDYGQYTLGLERLGFDVYYLEDTWVPVYRLNDETGQYEDDRHYSVGFLQDSLTALSPRLKDRWHYRAYDGQTYGLPLDALRDILADADVFLNVSGGTVVRDEYRHCPNKVLIDTDPGWNHFVIFPRSDSQPDYERQMGYRSHDHFFTFAEKIGTRSCQLPTLGIDWHITRQPVVMDCWEDGAADNGSGGNGHNGHGRSWTTVMMWNSLKRTIEHGGRTYGTKEREFERIEQIPKRSSASFEVAVSGDAPRERLRGLGWKVVRGDQVSATVDGYRAYIRSSRGEFSVAKNVYVDTDCGWFSCRSACYLAAGRPCVVQETGFSEKIPTGAGLFSFSTIEQAMAAIDTIESDYNRHQRAARQLAQEYFDHRRVLSDLLTKVGIG